MDPMVRRDPMRLTMSAARIADERRLTTNDHLYSKKWAAF